MHPRYVAGVGLAAFPLLLFWLTRVMNPGTAIWELLLPMALLGVANAFMWAPIGSTATRNLPMRAAGAGAGVYNTARQVGSVLGSAAIAVLMENRLAATLPGTPGGEGTGATRLPPQAHEGFSRAMSQSLWLPILALLIGLAAVLLFERPKHLGARPTRSDDSEGLQR